jgi:hypothetical protein
MWTTFLKQWRAIVGIVVLGATALAYLFGLIDETLAEKIGAVVGTFTGVMLKLAMNRTENHLANLAAKVVEPKPDPPVGDAR